MSHVPLRDGDPVEAVARIAHTLGEEAASRALYLATERGPRGRRPPASLLISRDLFPDGHVDDALGELVRRAATGAMPVDVIGVYGGAGGFGSPLPIAGLPPIPIADLGGRRLAEINLNALDSVPGQVRQARTGAPGSRSPTRGGRGALPQERRPKSVR